MFEEFKSKSVEGQKIIRERILKILESTYDCSEEILNKAGLIGDLIRRSINRVIVWTAWKIDKEGEFFVENDFVQDLIEFKNHYELTGKEIVLYIGSANDPSAKKVFPQTIHIDIRKPKPMPKNFNFVQADVSELPQADESVDIVIFKKMSRDTLEDKKTTQELQRVLKPNGKVIICKGIAPIEYTFEEIDEPLKIYFRAGNLCVLKNFFKNGFGITKYFPLVCALLEKREVSTDEFEKLKRACDDTKQDFYQFLEKATDPIEVKWGRRKVPLEYMFNLQELETILGLNSDMSSDEFEKRLQEIKAGTTPSVFKKIKYLLEKAAQSSP